MILLQQPSPTVPAPLVGVRDALLAQAVLCFLICVLLAQLRRRDRDGGFHRQWFAAWLTYLGFLLSAAAVLTPFAYAHPALRDVLRLVSVVCAVVHPVLLVDGMLRRVRPARPAGRSRTLGLVAGAVLLGAVAWYVGRTVFATEPGAGAAMRSLVRQGMAGLGFVLTAALVPGLRARIGQASAVLLSAMLAIWGASQLLFAAESLGTVLGATGRPVAWLPDLDEAVATRLAFLDLSWLGGLGLALVLGVLHELDRSAAEVRRLEAAIRHSQKMEAVGRLAGGIAHDFNNLLTAMLGSLYLAKDELPETHAAREGLQEAEDSARRAAELTRRLLAFSRRETPKLVPIDVAHALDDLHRLLRRLVGEQVTLTTTADVELPPVLADRSAFEQLVTNLCINARDALPDGRGTIRLRAALETTGAPLDGYLPALPAGTYVRLDVQDSGSGMDLEALGHLFEPFFTTKAVGQGTGLGLATVYGILEEMQAQVRVVSAPGAGTTVSLFLRSA